LRAAAITACMWIFPAQAGVILGNALRLDIEWNIPRAGGGDPSVNY